MTYIKKLTLGLLAFLMIAAATIGCSKTDNTGTIYGIVTVTGEPLKGIGVSLFADDALLLKTVTYDDGHYEFTDLKPKEYTLKVEAEGYNTFSTTVVVESGRQARADMQLTLVETGLNVITYEAVVSDNAALLKGHFHYSYSDSYKPDEIGFYYSTSTPVSNGTKVKTNDEEYTSYYNCVFWVNVPNLMPGTYYVQAYAKNSKGTTFGDIKTFAIKNVVTHMADFESGIPFGWETIDADGDGYTFVQLDPSVFPGHSGKCVSSASYIHNIGALKPDNYLVTPLVTITNGAVFSFWACAQDSDYPSEHFGVAISQSSQTNASSFTLIKEWTMQAKEVNSGKERGCNEQGGWHKYSVNLSSYAGKEVYIAIRHFNCTDQFMINVDDITINTGN